jgi:Cu+-exporting ATPase
MVSTGKAAEYGILVKSATSLESLHSINAIVLDKTGTITSGKPSVQKMVLYDAGLDQNSFLALAASLELGSEHPLGKAIVQKAQEQGLELQECSSFEALGGKGLKATLNGVQYLAGNQKLMEEEGVALNAKEKEKIDNLAMLGMTPLLFASNKQLIGIICVADTIRSTSEQALALLSEKGIKTIMLTGDNTQTAKAIASKLKIDEVIADVLPAQKENVIRTLQAQGYKVAMVGDGINDAPALSRAEVGIAIGAGTDIAIESADIVLMKDNLLDVNTAIDLSNATIRNIKQNLFWAFFYNTLGIPVAAGLLYPAFGITLSPMIGSLAMSLSSVCVVSNALRLRFFKPKDETKPEMQSQIESRQAQMEFEQLEQDIEKQAVPPVKIYEIGVGGMSCQHCAARVQKALLALPGVLAAQVNLNSESARIEANEQVEESSLKEAIEKAGYIPQERKTQTMKKEMKVGGMSCQHCAKHVKDALSAIDGVEDVEVNLPEGKAVFTETKPVASEKLIQAIEDAGYEPGEVTAI